MNQQKLALNHHETYLVWYSMTPVESNINTNYTGKIHLKQVILTYLITFAKPEMSPGFFLIRVVRVTCW